MDKKLYPRIGEEVIWETLDNGLPVCIVPKQGFSRKYALFATRYGGMDMRFELNGQWLDTPAGIAHYLEHKLFDLPGDRDVSAEFAELGANANAFTSYDMTAYYFSCTSRFSECLKLLLEFVSTPYFTRESVDKERGIIDQEIGMNEDNPDSVGFEMLAGAMYEKHPIRVPILGTSETIREITPENLYLCHRAFYTPGNMMLCVLGDVDPEEVTSIARQVLGDEPQKTCEKIKDWEEPMTPVRSFVRREMEVAMPTFTLAFKCECPGSGEEAIRQEMVADLAAEALLGESSDLYLKLYEQGLIDGSFGGGFETVDGCALFTCGGDSKDPRAVMEAVLARAAEMKDTGIREEDFRRMKRSALGRRIKSLDSFDATCFRLCAYRFSAFDYFRFPEVYKHIEKEDVEAFLARAVVPDRACLCVIDPISKEETK